MRQIFSAIIGCAAMLAHAATPMAYEATLTDAYGQPSAGEAVTLALSLADAAGNATYAEKHSVATDALGHIAVMVGSGQPLDKPFDETVLDNATSINVHTTRADGTADEASVQLGAAPVAFAAGTAHGLVGKATEQGRYALAVDNDGRLATIFQEADSIAIPEGYTRMIFHDEFDTDGLPDPTYWGYETGYVRNGELQYFTEARSENTDISNGMLHLTIRNDGGSWTAPDGTTPQYTSASIHTKDKVRFTYGRVDIRAKFSGVKGTWPGLWLMPNDSEYGGWPRSGEIDIVEQVGFDPEKVHFTAHCYLQNGDNNKYHHFMRVPTCFSDFHVYTFVWTEDKLRWYVDGKLGFTVVRNTPLWTGWPYDRDFYLILDMAWGGGWGGQQGIDPSGLPAECVVDYVRVFQ